MSSEIEFKYSSCSSRSFKYRVFISRLFSFRILKMILRFETFKYNFIYEWERMFGGICNYKDIENNIFSYTGTYGSESFLIYGIYHYDGFVPLFKIDKIVLKIFPESMKL